jgi:hypothetical protein
MFYLETGFSSQNLKGWKEFEISSVFDSDLHQYSGSKILPDFCHRDHENYFHVHESHGFLYIFLFCFHLWMLRKFRSFIYHLLRPRSIAIDCVFKPSMKMKNNNIT